MSDPHEVGARVVDVASVGRRPAQPGVLDDVLGVGDAAEHLVGHAEQQPPVPVEGGVVGGASRRAAGISQRSLKPWLVRPRALLNRDRTFSTATIMVSSTSAASSRCRRRLGDHLVGHRRRRRRDGLGVGHDLALQVGVEVAVPPARDVVHLDGVDAPVGGSQ